jgi:hypothetical protein
MVIKTEFEYIYMVWTRESKQLNEPVYKIGKTKQTGINRFNSYPNGSSLLFHTDCNDCTDKENQIKELFKIKYYPATLYGTEYFIGNYYEMIMDIIKITTVDYPLNNSSNTKKIYIELHKKLNNIPNIINQKERLPSNPDHEIENKPVNVTLEMIHPNIINQKERLPSNPDHEIDNKPVNVTLEMIQPNINQQLKNEQLLDNKEMIQPNINQQFNQLTNLLKLIIISVSVVSIVYNEKKSSIKIFEILEYFLRKSCNDVIYIYILLMFH